MGKTVLNQLVDKQLDGMVVKADDISKLAKDERADADSQHESANRLHVAAHKLEKLSDALRDGAAEIKAELESSKKPERS